MTHLTIDEIKSIKRDTVSLRVVAAATESSSATIKKTCEENEKYLGISFIYVGNRIKFDKASLISFLEGGML